MSSKSPSIVEQVGDTYLLLHRENYLDEETDVKKVVHHLATSAAPGELEELLESADWREAILGVYGVIAGRRLAARAALGAMLVRGKHRMLRRPLCLALAILGGEESAKHLAAFLSLPYDEDGFEEYAAALEAIQQLDPVAHARLQAPLLTRLAQEPYYESSDFCRSRDRFAAALNYWQAN